MPRLRATALVLTALLTIGGAPRIVAAQNARAVGPTPPRLAFVDGQVSFWRPGADDWAPAQINTALAAGDSVYAGSGGNAEIQIGSRAWVRIGSDTQLGVDSLDTGYLQLEVTSGHCAIDLKQLPEGQVVEVDTPSGAFTIERPGYYRVDVDDSTTFTARRGGEATVVPAGGDTTSVGPDQQVVLEGTDTARLTTNGAPAPDEWDRWNFDRTAHLAERPRSAEYVAPPVAGVDELDAYGDWRDTPRYGHVWVPRDVPADWAPYSTGRWVYDPYYEWTWVDDTPWGWAPYHYGRWCWADGYWGWAPGPIVAAPVYAPALVAFFGAGGVSVGIGVGVPIVSWVALGWGEPVLPWWGPAGFVGHPFWGGWGGPRVVNNVVINQTTIVNVRNINHFSNVDVRNAVVGVNREQFGRGVAQHVRVASDQARRLEPIRGQIGVRPVAASLVPKVGHAQSPPERMRNRGVVAVRPPQDPTSRLRAAGIEPRQPVRAVPPRVMQPSRGGERTGGGRQRGAERMAPPPAPGGAGGGRGPAVERAPGAQGGAPSVERGGANGERGRRGAPPPPPAGPRNERGGANVERGRGAVSPPATERGPTNERGGSNVERGRRGAPPPPAERAPKSERGGANVERGRHAAPPPPSTERAPTTERGGGRVERGRQPPPPAHERAPMTERGGANVERGRGAPPPAVRERAPSGPPSRQMQAPPPERGGGRPDGGAMAPPPRRERAVERAAPRERPVERAAPPREQRPQSRPAVSEAAHPPARQPDVRREAAPPPRQAAPRPTAPQRGPKGGHGQDRPQQP